MYWNERGKMKQNDQMYQIVLNCTRSERLWQSGEENTKKSRKANAQLQQAANTISTVLKTFRLFFAREIAHFSS